MRIRIEFGKEEKEVIMDAIDQQHETDIAEEVVGKFGRFSYDPKGFIDINLTTDFIKAVVKLISTFMAFIMSFVDTCESFCKEWFSEEQEQEEVPEFIKAFGLEGLDVDIEEGFNIVYYTDKEGKLVHTYNFSTKSHHHIYDDAEVWYDANDCIFRIEDRKDGTVYLYDDGKFKSMTFSLTSKEFLEYEIRGIELFNRYSIIF